MQKRVNMICLVMFLTAVFVFSGCAGKQDVDPVMGSPAERVDELETGDEMEMPYTYHVTTMKKNWFTENGDLAFTSLMNYPVFEGDTDAEKEINRYFEDWIAGILASYENEFRYLIESALEYKRAGAAMPASMEEYRLAGVIVREGIISVFQEIQEEPDIYSPDAVETINEKTDYLEKYYFSEGGVVFYTEPYEIGPYAMGYVDVVIPYDELGID